MDIVDNYDEVPEYDEYPDSDEMFELHERDNLRNWIEACKSPERYEEDDVRERYEEDIWYE